MAPDKNKIEDNINVAKENIITGNKETTMADITESLDNSPIWPASNEKEVTDQGPGCTELPEKKDKN